MGFFAFLGEFEVETGALAELGLDLDLAAVFSEDFLGDGEAEAGAACALGGGEDLEDGGEVFLGDADAVVEDGDAGGCSSSFQEVETTTLGAGDVLGRRRWRW